jgi:hypothetical protein
MRAIESSEIVSGLSSSSSSQIGWFRAAEGEQALKKKMAPADRTE